MKERKVISKIIILMIAILMIPLASFASSINLAIDVFRGVDDDGNYPAYALRGQYTYKIYEIDGNTTNYNKAIYCLDVSRGFGSGTSEWGLNRSKEYNKQINMLEDLQNFKNGDTSLINTYETNNNSSFSSDDYEKVVKILKKTYIPNVTSKEDFLKEMIPAYNSDDFHITDKDIEIAEQLAIWHYTNESTQTGGMTFGDLLGNTQLSEIYAAIYKDENKTNVIDYLNNKNYNSDLFSTTIPYKFYNLTDICSAIDSHIAVFDSIPTNSDVLVGKYAGINEIYKSFLKIAESNDTTNTNNVQPLEMANIASTIEEDNGKYIAGPFKITKNSNEYYDFNAKITDESNNDLSNYTLLDSNKTSTSKTLEQLVGEEFYISLNANTTIKKIKFSFTAKYDSISINYWTNGLSVNSTQPVAIVEKTPKDLSGEAEVEIKEKPKTYDLSLRKFISAIGNKKYTDRAPEVDVSNLIPNGTEKTARYVHPKTPLGVNVGDIVTYTIRVYNEGEKDVFVGKVTDYLPEELDFISFKDIEKTGDLTDGIEALDALMNNNTDNISDENKELLEVISFNTGYGWQYNEQTREISTIILSKNPKVSEQLDYTDFQKTIINDAKDRRNGNETTLLKAFDGTTLDYLDLQVKCRVNANAKSGQKITNIAEITKYEDENGNEIDKDRDSEPANFPDNEKNNNYEGNGNIDGYYPGKQDDDDFERLIIQQFDLSLRKFITDVDGKATTLREPQVDTSKLNTKDSADNLITTAEYNHIKTPITLVRGSIVTYTIRVYNEGDIDGYVEEITDYLPPELEYVENSDINDEYRWEVSKDGRTVTTDYLSNTRGTKNLIKAYDEESKSLDYKEVKIQCKVKDTAAYQKNITNLAQITKHCDDKLNDEIIDRDSEPDGGFELPEDKDLPSYKDDEISKAYVPGQEDDDDFEKVNVVYFDLALRKIVSKAIVIEDGNQTVTETNHKFEDDPEAIVKVDLGRRKLNKITVKFEYQIRITNEGLIEGYAKEVKDYIPEGLIFNAEENPLWKQESNGIITTDQLKDTLLKPGESKVISVLLTWKNDQNNLGLKTNTAEISKDYNEYNTPDIDSTPDNKKDGEDDIDIAEVMLSIALGNTRTYFGLSLLMLATTATGIFLIRKFVL